MRFLKIVTDSGYAIELSHVEENNTIYIKVTDTNNLERQGIGLEMKQGELHDLMDFLEDLSDIVESQNLLSDDIEPTSLDKDTYIKYLNDLPAGMATLVQYTSEPFNRDIQSVDFPNPDDIQAWLDSDESDKE